MITRRKFLQVAGATALSGLVACLPASPLPTPSPALSTLPPAPSATAAAAQTALLTPTLAATPTAPPAPSQAPTASPALPLTLSSTAFSEGGTIPDEHTYKLGSQCNGQNISPPLAWTGVPATAQSLAILMVDPDARNWVHWVQFNIPPATTELPATPGGPQIGLKGKNDFQQLGYGGPCPPSGTHRYIFTLYALSAMLSLSEGATLKEVTQAMSGQILAQAQLTGLRGKP